MHSKYLFQLRKKSFTKNNLGKQKISLLKRDGCNRKITNIFALLDRTKWLVKKRKKRWYLNKRKKPIEIRINVYFVIKIFLHKRVKIICTGVGQNKGNTWKFEINLFWYGFLIAALPWNPALCSSLLEVFKESRFSRWSLSSAIIFRAVSLWSFLTLCVKVWRSQSDSFCFLPEFWFSEEVFS